MTPIERMVLFWDWDMSVRAVDRYAEAEGVGRYDVRRNNGGQFYVTLNGQLMPGQFQSIEEAVAYAEIDAQRRNKEKQR